MKLKFAVCLALFAAFLWLGRHAMEGVDPKFFDGQDLVNVGQGHVVRLCSAQSNEAIPAASVTLIGPGGRVSAGRSQKDGRFVFTQTIYDDFPYRLQVLHSAFEPIDWQVRGAWLSLGSPHTLQLQECGQRQTVQVRYQTPIKGQLMVRWRWRYDLHGLGPPGSQGQAMMEPTERGLAILAVTQIPWGAHLEVVATNLDTGAGDRLKMGVPSGHRPGPLVVRRSLEVTSVLGRVAGRSGLALPYARVQLMAQSDLESTSALTTVANELGIFQLDLPKWFVDDCKSGQVLAFCDVDHEGVLFLDIPLHWHGERIQTIVLPTPKK